MSSLPEPVLSATDRDAAFEAAVETLQQSGDVDRLFDLRLLKAKIDLGLPIGRPESLADVPKEHRPAIEDAYRTAAREAGHTLLDRGDIVQAWSYFNAIGEPGPVKEAFDKIVVRPADHPEADYEKDQQLAHIALYERANPKKGVEMLLAAVGTCSTITSLDQAQQALSAKDREETAEVMVRSLYDDLKKSLTADIERRSPLLRPAKTLLDLLAGRDEIFAGGTYHIDVSHLSSVVRFARAIEPPSKCLDLAIELCEYGRRLEPSLQYASEPPFDTFYPAHLHFFSALKAKDADDQTPIDKADEYFRKKLADEPDVPDQRLIAYVLTDLLMRCGRIDAALDLAAEYLADTGPETGFSFAELCQTAERLDRLKSYSEEKGDVLGYLAGKFAK